MVVCCAQLSLFEAEEIPMSGVLSWGGMWRDVPESNPQTVSWPVGPRGESLHHRKQRRERDESSHEHPVLPHRGKRK